MWQHMYTLHLSRQCPRFALWLWIVAVVSAVALGQPAGSDTLVPQTGGNLENPAQPVTVNVSAQQHNVLLTVLNETKGRLDRQAVIKLHDRDRNLTVWQTTTTDSEATFNALNDGDYDLEISAVGYMTAHMLVRVGPATKTIQVTLQKDPNAIDLTASDGIPPREGKNLKRTIYELNSGHLDDAEKRLQKLYRLAPASAQVNFLYGYLFFLRKNMEKSETYLMRAAASDPRRVQTLLVLGRVQLQRQHYEDARNTLEQAIVIAPENWMAHNLLADDYLRLKQYDKARQQAQLAIDQGDNAASVAHLVLGAALASMGRSDDALVALKSFVQRNPRNPAATQAGALITQIEGGGSRDYQSLQTLTNTGPTPSLLPSSWAPPGIDAVRPPVAADVTCPDQHVIEMAGRRAKELVDNVARVAATEDLLHEPLDQFGNPVAKETRKFDYVATISESHPGGLRVDEYRNGDADLPDHIATKGFMALAVIFHPDMRESFQMTCEGLSEWRGEATWLIRYQQRDDRPEQIQKFVTGSTVYLTKLKGRAWITADDFQIVRIETEQIDPVPHLAIQHEIAEYGPVHFQKRNLDLWLPKSVDMYLELDRHRYFRRLTFDHYMLFYVNSEDRPQFTNKRNTGSPQNP
jgi:tetratricopeptide (TPR) repeat protein